MKQVWRAWRWCLVAGAGGLVLGGRLHPPFDLSRPRFEDIQASALASGAWVPVHALILVALLLATFGLWGLTRSGTLPQRAHRAAQVATLGAALTALEMVFHMSEVVDRNALVMGGPTPIVHVQEALQVVSHPVLGASVAALAVLMSGRLGWGPAGWAWRLASVAGCLGALAHGLAAPVVVLSRSATYEALFSGVAPLAIYLGALALCAPLLVRRARAQAVRLEPTATPATGGAGELRTA